MTIIQAILQNDKDKIIYAWLEGEYGHGAIREAIQSISGTRKPYVSNICKVLKATPPESLFWLSKEEVRAKSAELKALLKAKN